MKLQSIDMKPTKDIAKIATPHSVDRTFSSGGYLSQWPGAAVARKDQGRHGEANSRNV